MDAAKDALEVAAFEEADSETDDNGLRSPSLTKVGHLVSDLASLPGSVTPVRRFMSSKVDVCVNTPCQTKIDLEQTLRLNRFRY